MHSTSAAFVAATVGLCLALPFPLAAEEATFKDVTVDIAIDAATGANALTYYPEIEADLERHIIAQLPVSDDPNGYSVNVTLHSMSLDGDTILPDSREFNRLEGVALVTSPLTNATPHSIPIRISAETEKTALPEGFVVIAPSTDDFYDAMLAGFAHSVGRDVPEFMRQDASK